MPERDYTALNGRLGNDGDLKVTINKKEEKEALLKPLDERSPESLEVTNDTLQDTPIEEKHSDDVPNSFPNEDDQKK